VRIRHIAFGLGLGGTERAVQNFALDTARAGHTIDVVVLTDGPRRSVLVDNGIEVLVSPGDTSIAQQLAPVDILMIHSHGLDLRFVKSLLQASGRPVVGEINVFSTPSTWMSEVDTSFQLSPWAHWLYVKRGGDAARSSTLANPVDVEAFHFDEQAGETFRITHEIEPSKVLVGRVGQPLENKWSPWLVPALATLMQERADVHALLVGAPSEVANQARDRLDPSRLTLLARLDSDAALRRAYSALDVFAHASRQGESFGYVLAEAALTGCPIVTMATPWADNSQGFVAGPGARVAITPRGFTDHLRHAVGDTPKARDARRADSAGRLHVIENFATSAVNTAMIETLAGERPRVLAPTPSELSSPVYMGSDHYFANRLLSPWPRNRLRACFARQESVRWLASQEWNRLTGSR